MKKELPFKFGEVLLPGDSVDMTKWAVVACDQYTANPQYWQELETEVAGSPSSLNIIYPEIYLEDNTKERIDRIVANMTDYLNKDIFNKIEDGVIFVERTNASGTVRHGLMMLVDLTKYSFGKCFEQ